MKEEINEIKFTPSFYIGQIVYDVTNGDKGVVVGFCIDKRDVTYNVIFCSGELCTCYKVQLTTNYIE